METKERMHDTLTLEAGMPVIDGKGLCWDLIHHFKTSQY